MRPDLVIFDCDGVLVDSEHLSNRILAANLTAHGLPMTAEACMSRFVGGTMVHIKEEARTLGADLPDGWIDEIYGAIYAELRNGVDVIPGIPAVLDRLDAEGVPYCVASNGALEKMDITLGQTGLLPRFKGHVYSAYAVGISKPDPGLFLTAAQEMGVRAEACVVIEDSASGVTAAARADMRCLAYAPDGDGAPLSALGAEVFHDMADLPGRLHLDERRR